MKTWNMKYMKLLAAFVVILIMAGYGCGDKPASGPSSLQAPVKAQQPASAAASPDAVADPQETSAHEGYVYQHRDRRDPFVPLIMPARKVMGKDARTTGTLQSYDISEFNLSAIARKGTEYFALLVTADNRSFTVNKGSFIGLNRGKVNQILNDRVILVEYTKDFQGESKERKIILEFHKGETK